MVKFRHFVYFAAAVSAGAATAAVPAGTAGAAVVSARPTVYQTSISAKRLVKTSTGRRVSAAVVIADGTDDLAPGGLRASAHRHQPGQMQLRLTRRGETHTWTFHVPASSVALDQQGRGHVRIARARLGRFGRVSVSVEPRGRWRMHSCDGDHFWRYRSARIHGTFRFNTHSGRHGWGRIGSGHFSLGSARIEQMVNPYAIFVCPYYTPPPCHRAYGWAAYSPHAEGLAGDDPTVTFRRTHKLRRPRGAHRQDILTVPLKSATARMSGATPRVVLVGNGHRTRGRATLIATDAAPATNTETCRSGRTRVDETTWDATVHNGATPLRAAQLFGTAGLEDGATASITRYTPSGQD